MIYFSDVTWYFTDTSYWTYLYLYLYCTGAEWGLTMTMIVDNDNLMINDYSWFNDNCWLMTTDDPDDYDYDYDYDT